LNEIEIFAFHQPGEGPESAAGPPPGDEEEEEVPLFNPNASRELPQASDKTSEAIDTALKDLTPRFTHSCYSL